jgi:hypothetical protein
MTITSGWGVRHTSASQRPPQSGWLAGRDAALPSLSAGLGTRWLAGSNRVAVGGCTVLVPAAHGWHPINLADPEGVQLSGPYQGREGSRCTVYVGFIPRLRDYSRSLD